MGTTSSILRHLSPTSVATWSVESCLLHALVTAGLSHPSAKHDPLILQFHEVQRFEFPVLQEFSTGLALSADALAVWHC